MRVFWLLSAILIAVVLTACGGEPTSTPEPTPQLQTQPAAAAPAQSAAPAPPVSGDEDHRAEPQASAPRSQEVVEEQPAAASKQPLREAADQADAETVEPEPEPEPEEPPQDLTDVPATVVQDADVRLRPALVWRVIGRLEAGDAAVVLQQASGWYRIRYGDGQTGWIRAPMLELGEIEESQILHQPAEPLIAVWQGEQYGVMGQSPDGAEIRLLRDDVNLAEYSELVGAPVDEVTLLSDDVTPHDLPILIANETVVFPNGKFGVGEGKILPKSDQWLWLPWGWLLAHNWTHIWQWRPETDELEYAARPPGLAVLSPDGQYLAVDHICPGLVAPCERGSYAIILPLDGSETLSAFAQLHHHGVAAESVRPERPSVVLLPDWTPNSKAVNFYTVIEDGRHDAFTSMILHVDGRLVLFDYLGSRVLGDLDCYLFSRRSREDDPIWLMQPDNTMAARGACINDQGVAQAANLVFSLAGEFLGLAELPDPKRWEPEYRAVLVSTAVRSELLKLLSGQLLISWSPDDQRALAVDPAEAAVWIYDAEPRELNQVELGSGDSPATRLWDVGEPGEDWRVYSSWHGDRVAAVIVDFHRIRAALLIDADTGTGTLLDLGGEAYFLDRYAVQGWNLRGDAYYILLPFSRVDGLAVPIQSSGITRLLSFDRAGRLAGAVNVADVCGDSTFRGWGLRYRVGWSPNGEWIAVGGQQLEGGHQCEW